MEEADKGWLMTTKGMGGWMFLLVAAHPEYVKECSWVIPSQPHVYCLCACIGSRPPLSSKRPLLSVDVSVCPVSSPVHPLPVDRFWWNLAVRTHLGSNSLLLSFIHLHPLTAELWTKNLIFTKVTRNATPPTVLNPVFQYFYIMVSYVDCI